MTTKIIPKKIAIIVSSISGINFWIKKDLVIQQKAVKDAREYDNKGFQWTRRIIALTAIFAIVVFPKVIAVFFPEIPVTVGYTEFRPGFMFIPEKEVMQWKALQGLVITPLDTNLVGAIVGMYFGGSLVKR